MSAIELGDMSAAPAEPALAPPPLRRVAVALVAVLCGALVTGSAGPGPLLLRPLWSVGADAAGAILGSDTVFVLSREARVTAYEAGTGRVRWTRAVPVAAGGLTGATQDALLVPAAQRVVGVMSDNGTRVPRTVVEATLALDPRSGAEVWRSPGTVLRAAGRHALLAARDPADGLLSGMRLVRTSDGAALWAGPVRGAISWAVGDADPATGYLVTTAASGRAEVRRMPDGAVLADGLLPLGGKPGAGRWTVVDADAGGVYVNHADQAGTTFTVYDVATLRRRWQLSGAPTRGGAQPCGTVVCVNDGTATSAYDLATGAPRWRADDWTNATMLTPDRLLADSVDGRRHALLDAATGRLVAELGAGRIVRDGTDGRPLYYLSGGRPGGRITVSHFDPGTGRLRPRGSLAGVAAGSCTAGGDRLVCGTTGRRIVVLTVS